MKFNINTILSYFIKDIKYPKELAFYRGSKTNKTIKIFYKDELLYQIYSNNSIFNYKTNINKTPFTYCNYKLYSDKENNYKHLYYKNDNDLVFCNPNCIWYYYIYNKYLKKKIISYTIEYKWLINIRINYYKGYKYIFKFKQSICKFSQSLILIMNKYEIHYYNRFFNLYFVND